MTGQTLFLGMVLAAFASFMITLGGVSTWIMLGNLKAARLAARIKPVEATPEPIARAA